MEQLAKSFPQGLSYRVAYNTTEFIQQSVDEVIKTLFEAVILVVIVIILFLQTWRAAIIPIVAIPVSLIGTFFVMEAFGFSLNNLTLFGLVLAIGIVVDDAIVVVENVERYLRAGLSPRDAAYKTMDEVSRRADRHCSRALRRVHSGRVHHRHLGRVLPAIRPDHHRLDRHFRSRIIDIVARARGTRPAAARP